MTTALTPDAAVSGHVHFAAAANLVFGGLAVLVPAGILYLAVILAERWAFG